MDSNQNIPLPLTKRTLSTSSPEGLEVAAKITPNRLSNLLIAKGPLPIRAITSYLSEEVIGFNLLSLSKQRRLIMAAMEQPDTINKITFEKIGWGQWAARNIDSDFIYNSDVNINELKQNSTIKLGWTKKKDSRSDSISNQIKPIDLPKEPNSVFESDDSDDDDELNLPQRNFIDIDQPNNQQKNLNHNSTNNNNQNNSHYIKAPSVIPTSRRASRRQSNESSIRSTLKNQLINNDETDEEDWEALGPQVLQRNYSSSPNEQDEAAAYTLIGLHR